MTDVLLALSITPLYLPPAPCLPPTEAILATNAAAIGVTGTPTRIAVLINVGRARARRRVAPTLAPGAISDVGDR